METSKVRVLSAREMGILYRLSRPASFFATPEEKMMIERFGAEGIVRIYSGDIDTGVEVTSLGAECWYETLKDQARAMAGKKINTAGIPPLVRN